MKVQGIHHITILVKDLEAAGKLYSDLFGLKFKGPGMVQETDIRNLICPEGINLVSPLSPNGATARTLERRGEGLAFLALTVPNLEEACAEMKAKGIRQVGGIGTREAIFHPKDLHGVLVALYQD